LGSDDSVVFEGKMSESQTPSPGTTSAGLALRVSVSFVLLLVLVVANLAVAQGEEQEKQSVRIELVWEKEFPEGITDYSNVYFDKEKRGLFCPSIVVTGGGEDCKGVYFLDSTGKVTYERKCASSNI